MYHTEGFINPYTFDAKEHIIMLALEIKGQAWYLWCVTKEAIAETEALKQVLSFWLQQTLLTKGCKSEAGTQRELNRLGSYLQKGRSYGEAIEDVALFMYYCGRFYRWDSDMYGNNGKNSVNEHKKIYREITNGIYAYVSEDRLWEQYDERNVQSDALANEWELDLLEFCSLGKIKEGFFFIWEDNNDF